MIFGIIAAAVVGLYGLHRLALWAEDRGWIYYLRKQPSSTALGNAFLELHSLAEPDKKYVLEARRVQRKEEDDQGGPDHFGAEKPQQGAPDSSL
jgi:hypothetical protein